MRCGHLIKTNARNDIMDSSKSNLNLLRHRVIKSGEIGIVVGYRLGRDRLLSEVNMDQEMCGLHLGSG